MAGFGAFGKMPALGDFFRIAPPQGFVEVWDAWLQSRLLDLRNELKEHWRDAYLGAPIWRFTLSPGVAGPSAVLGVLMPSVDRVGRDFPLTLMAAVPLQGTAFGLHASASSIFPRLEEVALDALGEGAGLETLKAEIEGVSAPSGPPTTVLMQAPGQLALTTGLDSGAAILDSVGGGWSDPTIWSAAVGEVTRIFVTRGLPGSEYARPLFDLSAPLWNGQSMPAERRA